MNGIASRGIDASTGAALVAWCRTQVGVSWQHQGRVPGQGLDCVGLPICGARAVGFAGVVDMLEYSETPSPSQLLACVLQNCVPIEKGAAAQAGDLLLTWIRDERRPQHAMIDTGDGAVIHARRWMGDGRVVEDQFGPWTDRVHSRWRLKDWRDA